LFPWPKDLDVDYELASLCAVRDRVDELDLYRLTQQRFEELLVPPARAMAVREGNLQARLADRAAVAAVIGGVNLVPLSQKLSASDVRMVEPVQQIIKIPGGFLKFDGLIQHTAADALTAAILHDPFCLGFTDFFIQQEHLVLNPLGLLRRGGKRFIRIKALQNTGLYRFFQMRRIQTLFEILNVERHCAPPFFKKNIEALLHQS
jgi:hypothetical protein